MLLPIYTRVRITQKVTRPFSPDLNEVLANKNEEGTILGYEPPDSYIVHLNFGEDHIVVHKDSLEDLNNPIK